MQEIKLKEEIILVTPHFLFQQNHLPCLYKITCLQLIIINSAAKIDSIKFNIISAGVFFLVNKGCDFSAEK